MTTQSVAVTMQTQNGLALSFQDHSVTDGTAQELTSGGWNQVTGQSAGTLGDGLTVTHALAIFGDNGVYAYLANPDGSINQALSMMRAAAGIQGMVPLCRPVRLIPGMTIQVRSGATGATAVSMSVYCASGVSHIFIGTAGSAGAVTNLTSIINSSDVGSVLTGQTIVKAFVSSTADWDAAEAAGFPAVACIAGNGQSKAFWPQQMPVYNQPTWQSYPVRIDLNDVLQIDTDTS
jgi:hypothetical protein